MSDALHPPLKAPDHVYDMLVIGGGINGAGIAREAAGRGLSVLLVEKDDLAQHTSSASTKLIHGGLRYLEYGEFRLVRESLIERERLLAMAPHIIWPMAFVLPQVAQARPAWLVRLGLFLYDHLGGRKRLPATRTVQRLDRDPLGNGLKSAAVKAFVYADCWVDDSRLVVLNAMDARARGADVRTRTRLVSAQRIDGGWVTHVEDERGVYEARARVLVNAAGPWVADVIEKMPGGRSDRRVRLVKGSHIVVPRLFDGEHAFLLQNDDKRVVFAIPYEGEFTLVGTTDLAWNDAPGPAQISPAEVQYLLKMISRTFVRPVSEADIVWTYAGIRPLYDDHASSASAVTRDYVLDLDAEGGAAPALNIFGGKITTYRKLAEHAMERLEPFLRPGGVRWESQQALPGGGLPDGDFDQFLESLKARYPAFSPTMLRRLARAYGTKIGEILRDASDCAGLGRHFGGDLYQAEVDYLVDQEFARTGRDILFRRSKLGLHVAPEVETLLDEYLGQLSFA